MACMCRVVTAFNGHALRLGISLRRGWGRGADLGKEFGGLKIGRFEVFCRVQKDMKGTLVQRHRAENFTSTSKAKWSLYVPPV